MTYLKVNESDHIVKNVDVKINIYGDAIEPEEVDNGGSNYCIIACSIICFVLWVAGVIAFSILASDPYPKDKTNPFVIMVHILVWPVIIAILCKICGREQFRPMFLI